MSTNRSATAYLLGAGFSRAVSSAMPTMRGLREQLRAVLGYAPADTGVFDDDLEAWLSFLATPQPWLDEPANLRNRALYVESSAAIFEIIEASEEAAVAAPMPVWLQRFLTLLADQTAPVITFNYDLLLERGFFSLGRIRAFSDIYVAPVVERMRPGTNRFLSRELTPEPHLMLHKLHGSINWYTSSNDARGGLFVVRDLLAWPNSLMDPLPGVYADLRPMIIPPVATKTPFYDSLALQAGWQQAAAALRKAEQLTIIGYSLPPADTSTTAMIKSCLSPDAAVTVVDLSDETVGRVAATVAPRRVTSFAGPGATVDYVNATCPHHVEWGCERTDHGELVAHISIDGTEIPASDLPNLPTLGPDSWPEPDRLARYVGQRWPGATVSPLRPTRWEEAGGLGFAYEMAGEA